METVLIGESILAAHALPLSGKEVLDFGSGAGIPGLVWAIYDSTVQITSLEIRARKIAFQKEVARNLDLYVEILLGRFPDAVERRKFDVITTRAVRVSPELWKNARVLLKSGGSLIQFAKSGARLEGWDSIPISNRSCILKCSTGNIP
jgi:16S rRNA (guanine527-N7)-methyltransferase